MTSIFLIFAPAALRRYGCLRFRSAGAAEPRSFRFRARFARGVYVFYSAIRQQVPKPMYEDETEGAM